MPRKSDGFGTIRPLLLKQRPDQLVRLISDLYRLSPENRRFLGARLEQSSEHLPRYRKLLPETVSPDPLRSGAKVRLADAKRLISEYERATGDAAGTLDLMLTCVEETTAFAADLGYGDEAFFSSLERMLWRSIGVLQNSPPDVRHAMEPRLNRLRTIAPDIGWGYGDFVSDAVDEALRSSP